MAEERRAVVTGIGVITPIGIGRETFWEGLRRLRFGETVSYSELARRVGAPDAVRAVGAANGRNPIPIIVPCHRVIGADGSLTGFGGGLPRKLWLLDHERMDLFGER